MREHGFIARMIASPRPQAEGFAMSAYIQAPVSNCNLSLELDLKEIMFTHSRFLFPLNSLYFP